MIRALKKTIKRSVNALGYDIAKFNELRIDEKDKIDVLPLIVEQLYKELGRRDLSFLQIGANDGVAWDPIRPFRDRDGWRGTFVEPNPHAMKKLKANSDPARSQYIEAAVTDKAGTATLYFPTDDDTVAGTLDGTNLLDFDKRAEVVVKTIPAKDLWDVASKADVWAIDTEGFDYVILEGLLAGAKPPTLLNFEHILMDRNDYGKLCARLVGCGYKILACGQDTICLRKPAGALK
jgi:FkbM family methyltransferase